MIRFFIVDLRINETLQIRLVKDADESAPVRLETAPTGGESVYLFLVFTIISINHKLNGGVCIWHNLTR